MHDPAEIALREIAFDDQRLPLGSTARFVSSASVRSEGSAVIATSAPSRA